MLERSDSVVMSYVALGHLLLLECFLECDSSASLMRLDALLNYVLLLCLLKRLCSRKVDQSFVCD